MRRLLFIAPSPLGDALLTTGVLRHFIEADHPSAVHIACGAVSAPLFSALTPHVTVIKKQPYARHWWDLWQQDAPLRWHRVVDMRGSAFSYTLWARHRHRFVKPKGFETQHKLKQIAASFGLNPLSMTLGPWYGPQHQAEAAPYLGQGPLLCLAPFATWVGKEWPLERFRELALRLTDGPLRGGTVVLMGAPNETERVHPFLADWPADRPLLNLVGRLSLPALFVVLQNAALAVCNDSGLMHLAAASGVPTVGLFGPSPDTIYAPWGPNGHVIRTQEPHEALITQARAGVGGSLLASLSVDRVYDDTVAAVLNPQHVKVGVGG
ncbi:MAG: glycosyltransferase family 9 protein [Alphaproteobacteria bacterium]